MTFPLKPFYFLRHGETEWNRQHIYMGSKDIPLNQTGEDQAKDAADILKNEDIRYIVTSPLIRAKRTAEIVNQTLKVEISVINELAECCWGEFEGKAGDDGTILRQWIEGNSHKGAEHVKDFVKRVVFGVSTALQLPGPTLIVAHGGVYGVVQRVLGLHFLNLKNCASIFHKPPTKDEHSWSVCQIENESCL